MLQRLPWPKEARPFEELCLALWASMEPDYRWHAFGRTGQAQHGVDVIGERAGSPWIGVQCKARDRFLGSTVTTKHVDAWIAAAGDRGVELSRLVLATTAPDDASVQAHVKERSDASTKRGGFSIEYWSWDRIERALFESRHEDVLAQFFVQYGFRSQRRERIVTYLRGIAPDLQKLPLRHLREASAPLRNEPALTQIYTMLDVEGQIGASGPRVAAEGPDPASELMRTPWTLPADATEVGELVARVGRERSRRSSREHWPSGAEPDLTRPATILEASAVNPRLLIAGPGGSGKTAFLRYLALCLAGENLRHAGRTFEAGLAELCGEDPTRWTHGMLVPLWVELRDFATSTAFPRRSDQATRARLWTYLGTRGAGAIDDDLRNDLEDLMADAHAVPGVLLVLDGVDELPDRAAQTPLLLDVLADYLRAHPKSRVLLTARPYAIDDDGTTAAVLRELGFAIAHLMPPSDGTIVAFLRAWFEHTRGDAALAKPLLAEIHKRPLLRGILRTPLILTMVADMFDTDGRAWGNVADVFENAVRRLVDSWNKGRGIPGAELLSPHEDRVRSALEELAWRVQTEIPAGARDAERWFGMHLLEETLATHGVAERDAPGVRRYLDQRCGILECDNGSLRFAHRNIMEFLTATHAGRLRDSPLELLEQARHNETAWNDWRETLLFAGARGARGAGVSAWTLLDYAVPDEPPVDIRADDPRFSWAAIWGQVAADNRLDAPTRRPDRDKLDRLRAWLKTCLTVGALAPRDRAAVGRHLALLGDDRKGVGVDARGLPDIDWVRVDMPRKKVLLVARYPVTNAQFAAFVADGGYTDARWNECWGDAGLAWRDGNAVLGPSDHGEPFTLANHPRVGVSLYEARAFAAWLSIKRKREVRPRLPTDDERLFIGCGDEMRIWRWGGDFGDGTRNNGWNAGIGSTCAVGMYPTGSTPDFGVHDVSGNVFEWALRLGSFDGIPHGSVLGSSWLGFIDFLKPDLSVVADFRSNSLGFRLASSAQ